jgi:P27 family predicted phage terminase small subunit
MAKPYSKPARLRELDGDKKRPETVEAPGALGAAPAWMGKNARAIWGEALASAPPGLLRNADASVFAVWVAAYDLFIRAAKESQKTAVIGKTPNGYPMVSPCHIVMKQQAELMMRAAQQLGFSPTARARIPERLSEMPRPASSTTPPSLPAEQPSGKAVSPAPQRTLWGARGQSRNSSKH